jgi:hypothetical protein
MGCASGASIATGIGLYASTSAFSSASASTRPSSAGRGFLEQTLPAYLTDLFSYVGVRYQ